MPERGREGRRRRPGGGARYGPVPGPDAPDLPPSVSEPSSALGPGSLIHRIEDLADELEIGADAVLEQALGLLRRLARIGVRWGTTPAGALRELLEQSRRLEELRRAAAEPGRPRRSERPARASERLPLAWVALRRELDDLRAREEARVFGAMAEGGRRHVEPLEPLELPAENPLLDEAPGRFGGNGRRGARRGAWRGKRVKLSPVQLYRKLRDEAERQTAPAAPVPGRPPAGATKPASPALHGAPRGAHARAPAPGRALVGATGGAGPSDESASAPVSRLPATIEIGPVPVEPDGRGRATYADRRRPLKKIEL